MICKFVPILLVVCICSGAQAASDLKPRLIALQSACENFICKLSEQPTPDVRVLKQQVMAALEERGFTNSIVEINFYSSLRSATMTVEHDQFRIHVDAKEGKLTSTDLDIN